MTLRDELFAAAEQDHQYEELVEVFMPIVEAAIERARAEDAYGILGQN